jgi:hypothetical protein
MKSEKSKNFESYFMRFLEEHAIKDLVKWCPYTDCEEKLIEDNKYKVIGIEDDSIYDGIIAWKCPSCERYWPRKGKEKYYEKWVRKYAKMASKKSPNRRSRRRAK